MHQLVALDALHGMHCIKYQWRFHNQCFQLEFGRTTSLPFVSASNCGLPGLWQDLILLTDSMHGRKMMQQAAISFTKNKSVLNHLKCGVTNLCFVTQFNLSFCELLPQQLEQVAFECPNLQQLNVQHNEHCFRNLRGLHVINVINLCLINLCLVTVKC